MGTVLHLWNKEEARAFKGVTKADKEPQIRESGRKKLESRRQLAGLETLEFILYGGYKAIKALPRGKNVYKYTHGCMKSEGIQAP